VQATSGIRKARIFSSKTKLILRIREGLSGNHLGNPSHERIDSISPFSQLQRKATLGSLPVLTSRLDMRSTKKKFCSVRDLNPGRWRSPAQVLPHGFPQGFVMNDGSFMTHRERNGVPCCCPKRDLRQKGLESPLSLTGLDERSGSSIHGTYAFYILSRPSRQHRATKVYLIHVRILSIT